MPTRQKSRVELYRRVYEKFQAPVSRFDCGRHCAPHNGGQPVCCDTGNAVPIVDKWEWQLLKSRSDLWRLFKPKSAIDREIVAGMHSECRAVECKGAAHCERDNRSLACRAFPFFPYITREREVIGLAGFWYFEDRCWVLSNLGVVTPQFVTECLEAYEAIFAEDAEEFDVNRKLSADMRGIFTKRGRVIPLIGRDGGYYAIEPKSHRLRPATLAEFGRHGPYKDEPVAAAAAE